MQKYPQEAGATTKFKVIASAKLPVNNTNYKHRNCDSCNNSN